MAPDTARCGMGRHHLHWNFFWKDFQAHSPLVSHFDWQHNSAASPVTEKQFTLRLLARPPTAWIPPYPRGWVVCSQRLWNHLQGKPAVLGMPSKSECLGKWPQALLRERRLRLLQGPSDRKGYWSRLFPKQCPSGLLELVLVHLFDYKTHTHMHKNKNDKDLRMFLVTQCKASHFCQECRVILTLVNKKICLDFLLGYKTYILI